MTARVRPAYMRDFKNAPRRDFFNQLLAMGAPLQIVRLSSDNGHICHELPVCRKPAAWSLMWMDETINLCADGYKRWKEAK